MLRVLASSQRLTRVTFDDFWALYPRHDAKKDARKAWDRVDPALHDQIVVALEWQVQREQWQDPHYIPLPASWLRGERWEDERRVADRRVSKGGIQYQCPHQPRCLTTWACGKRQLQERQAS